jgi:hypothetical protein
MAKLCPRATILETDDEPGWRWTRNGKVFGDESLGGTRVVVECAAPHPEWMFITYVSVQRAGETLPIISRVSVVGAMPMSTRIAYHSPETQTKS